MLVHLSWLPSATKLERGFRLWGAVALCHLRRVNVQVPGGGQLSRKSSVFQQICGVVPYGQRLESHPVRRPRDLWVFLAGTMRPGIRNFREKNTTAQHESGFPSKPTSPIAGIFGLPSRP